jgi:F-box-like
MPLLPDEMVHQTLQLLSTPDLIRAAQVSKQLNRVCKVLLWSTISDTPSPNEPLYSGYYHDDYDYPLNLRACICSRNKIPRLRHLLRSLLERPILGRLVRKFSLHSYCCYCAEIQFCNPDPLATRELSNENLQRLFSFIQEESLGNAAYWTRAVQVGNVDAIFTIILAHLPNLERFELNEYYVFYNRFLGSLLRKYALSPATGQCPPLDSLKHVSFRSKERPPSTWPDPDALLAPFYLPSVETLLVEMPEPWSRCWTWGITPTSNLTSLTLRWSDITPHTLGTILAATPKLEILQHDYFQDLWDIGVDDERRQWNPQRIVRRGTADDPHPSWDWKAYEGDGADPYHFDCNVFCTSLLQVKNSLRILRFAIGFNSNCANDGVPVTNAEYGVFGNMSGLCQMDRLQVLDVPLFVLLGWSLTEAPPLSSVIPPCVQEVHFGDLGDGLHRCRLPWNALGALKCLQAYFGRQERSRSSLTTIILKIFPDRGRYQSEVRDWSEPDIADFCNLCEQNGVEPKIEELPRYHLENGTIASPF